MPRLGERPRPGLYQKFRGDPDSTLPPFREVVTRKDWGCNDCLRRFGRGTKCVVASYMDGQRTVTVRYCLHCWNACGCGHADYLHWHGLSSRCGRKACSCKKYVGVNG